MSFLSPQPASSSSSSNYGSSSNSNNNEEEEILSTIMEEGRGQTPKMITHLSIMREDSPLLSSRSSSTTTSTSTTMEQDRPTKANTYCCCYFFCARIWKAYEQEIQERPVMTKCVTAAMLVGLGDFVSQQLLMRLHHHDDEHDTYESWKPYQTWEFACMGFVLQAPVTHYYYRLLDAQFPPTPSPWTWMTLVKLLIDQLLFAPTFLVAVFVFFDTLEGGLRGLRQTTGTNIWQHLQDDLGRTLVANWKLWVPATWINLALCPPAYRVLFCNVVFFVWSILLSMLLHPTAVSSS